MNLVPYNINQFLRSSYRFFIYTITTLYISTSFFVLETSAQAGGLTKARSTLQALKDELMSVVPIVAIISLVILGISYAAKIVEKETFMRWTIGVIIVGSATQITKMLL